MIETGLAFLVFLSPLLFLGLLIKGLDGITGLGARRRDQPSCVGHAAEVDDGQGRLLLASDVERDESLRTISQAVGEGRLGLDEAERRIEAVLLSRHRHELVELVGDLPPTVPSEPPNRRTPSTVHPGRFAWAAIAILAAVVLQALAGLWELWPVAVAGCGLLAARARR